MTTKIANELYNGCEYDVFYLYHIQRIVEQLCDGIKKVNLPFSSITPLPCIRNLNLKHILHVKKIIKNINPELMIVSQGNIEFGLKGLLAGKLSKIRTVAYIPAGYTFKETRSPLAVLRDPINTLYYKLPDAYITVNRHQSTLLRRFVKHTRVFIINNPVEDYPESIECKNEIISDKRQMLNIGVVGRIYFKTKNQSVLIDVAKLARGSGRPIRFHIIGEGKDKPQLERLIKKNQLDSYFRLHGWMPTGEMKKFILKNVDLIVIPSNYEALPLIMLESLLLKKAFLISDLDFLRCYNVPRKYIIKHSDPVDIYSKILAIIENFELEEYLTLRYDILRSHSLECFKNDLVSTFSSLMEL